MNIVDPSTLGLFFGVSELGLLISHRSGGGAQSADRGSLLLLWGVILASISSATVCATYSGALLAFVGLGICYRNWLGLLLLVIPTTLAFMRRIQIEEAALLSALGQSYARYRDGTRWLIPFVY